MPIMRRSRKRDAMLELLRGTTCHPSADWLFRRLQERYPSVSMGTIYRNLAQLREEGLIKSVGVVDGQERFDARMDPHGHFVCQRCGRILDLPDCVSGAALAPLGEQYGFTAKSYELHVYGLCRACENGKDDL